MSLQCYNRTHRGYCTLKRENHPVEANRSQQTLWSVRLVATHRWINRFVCLAFTYVRYVQRISAGHAGPAVSFDEFSLFVPPTRLCRSLASSPRAVFILQHVASFFFFFFLFLFYSPILLFLILYSQLRARRVDRACVNMHIICDRNMHFKLVFFGPNYDRSKLQRHDELCCRKLSYLRSCVKGLF